MDKGEGLALFLFYLSIPFGVTLLVYLFYEWLNNGSEKEKARQAYERYLKDKS